MTIDEPAKREDAILAYLQTDIWPELDEEDDSEPTMIERIARALCIQSGLDPNYKGRIDGASYHWQEYVKDAVAALREMMEPTGEMVGDAYKTFIYSHGDSELERIRAVWSKMIDAALLGA